MTRLGDAVYRLVLQAFPAPFRARHGHAMLAQFQLQRRALRSRPLALCALWVRAGVDSVRHGLALRHERRLSLAARRPVWEAPMSFMQDVRYAARGLARDRGVTMVVVLTLTLGIAANAIMFGVVDQLLLSPPQGIGHADDVRRVYFGSESPRASGRSVTGSSYPKAAAVRDGVDAFASAAVLFRERDVTVGAGAGARSATLELANADYFPLLELRPVAGRFYTRAEDGVPDAAPVAVLSHSFWTRAFGGQPGIVGSTLRVEGKVLTVVGIAPPGFSGISAEPVDLWAPPGALARDLVMAGWESYFFRYGFEVVARLGPDATDQVATAQATAAVRRTAPPPDGPGVDPLQTAFTVPLQGLRAPNGLIDEGKVGLWLLGVAIVVLLVAMANVANVLLARTIGRRKEIAVRLAVGVSRTRLVRQLLTESALLAGMAATVAIAVAYLAGRFVQQTFLPGFAWDERLVDARLLGVTTGLVALTTLAAGLAPAWRALSTDMVGSLGAGTRTSTGRTGGLRSGLLIAQVALSVVLLVGAGLFVRSFSAVQTIDVGMDLDRVILARLPERPGVPLEEAEALHDEATARLAAVPGVEGVTITRNSSPMGISSATTVLSEGETLGDSNGRAAPSLSVVQPDYFAVLGAALDRGRLLLDRDRREGSRVAVINRALEAERWPDVDPVGQCVYFGQERDCTRIVGVVENIVLYDRVANDTSQLYVLDTHPVADESKPRGVLLRTEGKAADVAPAVRAALQSLRSDMPFVPVDTMETLTAPQLQPWRLGATMFLAFGGVALLIAAVGLYSTMAYLVSQRAREIGIRIALGASRRHVIARIGAHGASVVATGLAAGLLVSAMGTPWLADLLYETSPRDPWVFATVAIVLAAAGVAAAVVPARRSTAVDPLVVLKAD